MKAQVTYQPQPLQNLQLQGLHLIEASAGTGKTWTLSSLMVRILTEKYMPRQVIATTFTRAAAAELKSRIRNRLLEMYHVALDWEKLSNTQYQQVLESLTDPLQQIIFKYYQHNELHDFGYLVNRLRLVIDSLDELFVGTIDSFTQKLLREFAFDSGELTPRQISDDEQQYTYQIIHDVLRAWLQSQPQDVIDLLLWCNQLKQTEAYIDHVAQTLNFTQATLQAVTCPDLDLAALKAELQTLIEYRDSDLIALQDYFYRDGAYYPYVSKHAFKDTRLHSLKALIDIMQQQGIMLYFSPVSAALVADVEGIFLDSNGKFRPKLLNKCDDSIRDKLYQQPLFRSLNRIVELRQQLKQQLVELDDYLHYYLSLELKQRLPQVLLQAGETTFNQQIATLSAALQGEHKQRLAQAIQQRYPIILVDEFQDTNQQQDNMLQAIWRDASRVTQGCFIAVGDPKQAIYGFRGGDVLTYINAFNDIAAKQGGFYRLSENFRSIPALVQAVDALFMRQTAFGEGIDYYTAQAGLKDDAPLIEAGQKDTQPLRWLALNEQQNGNEAYLIAHKIRYLLAQAQQGQLYIERQGQKQPIIADDIAVLAGSNFELNQLQKQLEALQIPVNRTTQNSVFSSASAQDVGALLQAMQQPEREAVLKRALLTPAIGLTLQDFCQFEQDAEGMNQHVQHFRYARQLWLQKGFLIAWQWLAEKYLIWQNLAAHTGLQAERAIVNTRHLIEVLSQHSRHYASVQHLIQWYQLQLGSPALREWELERQLSSESGVQLMTIHKSKGLEFKIVFLMHANKDVDVTKTKLGFYQDADTRVIAISPKLIEKNDAAKQAHLDKIYGENHRLWYVALTRASYRIYAVLPYQKTATQGGIAFWLTAQQDEFQHAASLHDDAVSPNIDYQQQQEQMPELYAVPYPAKQFYPKKRTSFSQLAAHLHYHQAQDALAEFSVTVQAAEDEVNYTDVFTPSTAQHAQPLPWIQQYFPKGKQGGNCLHAIFEQIDFQKPQTWGSECYKQLHYHGLWQPLLAAYTAHHLEQADAESMIKMQIVALLQQWIGQILATPLLAVQGFALKDLTAAHRLPELSFYLGLADQRFNSQIIHQLFLDDGIVMPAFETAHSARYLNGAIDLVFFDGQRYHIADYKSNTLGESLEDYAINNIERNMSMASYWLQASIYLVVLHRYLKVHLQGYVIEQHLGAAHYLYLRGMMGQQDYGVKSWQPDVQFILELDGLLGVAANAQQTVDNYV